MRTVLFQNSEILLLERFLFVMLLLIENIFPNGLEMRCAYTEQPVTVLPVEIWNAQGLYEFGRILLENLDDFRCGEFFCEIAENMNVVNHTTNGD